MFIFSIFYIVGCNKSSNAILQDNDIHALNIEGTCNLSNTDRLWVSKSMLAWEAVHRKHLNAFDGPNPLAIFFDATCQIETTDFVTYSAKMHGGTITLPNGQSFTPSIQSFAAPTAGNDTAFFVMAVPSLWVQNSFEAEIDTELFLTAVLIHEMSHVSQFSTYLSAIQGVVNVDLLNVDIHDDVIQFVYGENEIFSRLISEEIMTLQRAATTLDNKEARKLGVKILTDMQSRRSRYFVDEASAYLSLEDIFLTLEGSGQWLAYDWLTSSSGGNIAPDIAMKAFGLRGDKWTQHQGFLLFMILERLNTDWTKTVYGSGDKNILELLEQTLL